MPPNLIWNGGRPNLNNIPYINYNNVFTYFSNFTLKHTCTNCLIDKELINDKACNEFIKKYTKPNDYIIINSKILYNHLLQFFPKNHFIWSATLDIVDINLVNELSMDQIVVLEYNYNNNDSYLEQLKNKHNIEIICAEPCIAHCPNRKAHYLLNSQMQLSGQIDQSNSFVCPSCDYTKMTVEQALEYQLSLPHGISNERINILSQMGFQDFKISGRFSTTPYFFYIICYYLVKEQYRELVFKNLLIQYKKNMFKNKISVKY